MTHLLRAETLKVLSLRATYLGLAVTTAAAAELTALISHTANNGDSDLADRREVLTLAGSNIAPAMALLLAMLVMGSEFRHNTITPALLITPDRRRLFLAKAALRRSCCGGGTAGHLVGLGRGNGHPGSG